MTQSEAFEATLARGGDSTVLRAKRVLNPITLTSTPSLIFSITPATLSTAFADLGEVFTRFRVKQLVVRFLGTNTVVVGILDDANGGEGDAPGSIPQLSELRCSGASLGPQTVPTEIMWKPTDPEQWYYTQAGGSGSDPRLTSPGTLYAGSNATDGAVMTLEIDVVCVFKGVYV